MSYKRQNAIDEIIKERERQDKLWGHVNDGHTNLKWMNLVLEEVGEVAKALNDGDPAWMVEEEIIQVAALCVAWVEKRKNNAIR